LQLNLRGLGRSGEALLAGRCGLEFGIEIGQKSTPLLLNSLAGLYSSSAFPVFPGFPGGSLLILADRATANWQTGSLQGFMD
jgi:hypothetical protein